MDETYLYQQIAETLRKEILAGTRKPGEKLPTVRNMTTFWNCTAGTVQRAYKILAKQGLIQSRPGQGTHVATVPELKEIMPLRRATLFNRTENFLLESISAGYSQNEIELAMRMALDRWRVVKKEIQSTQENVIRYAGSNDIAIAWISAHFSEILPSFQLSLQFGGSLGGLIALAEGKADIAGSHLWDEVSQDYNIPYIERILPGKKTALVTLAQRQLGLIVPRENPLNISGLHDLVRPEIRFVNRQSGSGTRVWLDSRLHDLSIPTDLIQGYNNDKFTHTDVARSIVDDHANTGIGLKAAANAFDLGFVDLTSECFELVIPFEILQQPAVKDFIAWLATQEAHNAIDAIEGYDASQTGQIRWIN